MSSIICHYPEVRLAKVLESGIINGTPGAYELIRISSKGGSNDDRLSFFFNGKECEVIELAIKYGAEVKSKESFDGAIMLGSKSLNSSFESSSYVLLDQDGKLISSSVNGSKELICIAFVKPLSDMPSKKTPICLRAEFSSCVKAVAVVQNSELCKMWKPELETMLSKVCRSSDSNECGVENDEEEQW